MKIRLVLAFLASCGALAMAQDPGKVVITIGDEKITEAEFNSVVDGLPQQYQAQARGAGKRQFAEQLVQLRVLAAEAEKEKLADQAKVKNQLAFSRLSVLASGMFQQINETTKVDDAAIEKYFNDHRNEFETVKAHHILIHVKGAPGPPPSGGKPELSDEEALAKAKALKARIAAGESFEDVARKESDDSSAAKGGDLGEFGKGMMVPPFEQAAFGAKVGEITDPVRSPFGYHLIRVDAHTAKPLADAKGQIEAKLRPELARQKIDAMTKALKVTLDDGFFGPAPAPAAPPAAK